VQKNEGLCEDGWRRCRERFMRNEREEMEAKGKL
jgi:hypothetical protein